MSMYARAPVCAPPMSRSAIRGCTRIEFVPTFIDQTRAEPTGRQDMQAAAGTAPKYVHDRACTRGGKRANARLPTAGVWV